ncbi:MAG: preprotein translocase subunit YajC [Peptococcia bacterium]
MQAYSGVLVWVLVIVLIYFMIIKPQRKQQKLRQEMLSNLKVGDNVVTLGGIHGKIVRITDDIIKLEVAENVRLKMQREAVNFVVEDED